jgi:hypothetical protein
MTKDFEKLCTEGPDPLADDAGTPVKPPKTKKPEDQNYLHANFDDIIVGVESAGIVWLRLLQLRRMRKGKYLVLGNDWLTKHGVDRFAKSRALRTLETRGLIHIERSDHRSPRVHIIPRAKRRVRKSQQRGAD